MQNYENIISHCSVYGLNNALRVSGFPMRLTHNDNEDSIKAINRGKRLGNEDSVSAEDNYLCGIVVQFDLSIPNKNVDRISKISLCRYNIVTKHNAPYISNG